MDENRGPEFTEDGGVVQPAELSFSGEVSRNSRSAASAKVFLGNEQRAKPAHQGRAKGQEMGISGGAATQSIK